MGSSMSELTPAFNPARFVDILKESGYRTGWGKAHPQQRRERIEIVEWLRKKYKDRTPCQALADKLDNCKPKARCKSAACPDCSTAAQDLVTEVTRKFLKKKAKAATIVGVSIVPADGTSAPDQLTPDQHARNVRRFKERLGRAGVTWFLGGSDWSFNQHDQDRYPAHWSHHFYGFTATTDPEDLKKRLQAQFPKTDVIPRPVKVQEWDGDTKPIVYMVKLEFNRRIATDDGQRLGRATCRRWMPASRNLILETLSDA
jgi:hypothetical protein